MASSFESQPNLDLALLHHDGTVGAYAIRIDEQTGQDGALLGKSLARFAVGRGLTGIISPDNAPYNVAMHAELDQDREDNVSVAFHQLDTGNMRPELLGETPFLTLLAKAIMSRQEHLGRKVGIVQSPTNTARNARTSSQVPSYPGLTGFEG